MSGELTALRVTAQGLDALRRIEVPDSAYVVRTKSPEPGPKVDAGTKKPVKKADSRMPAPTAGADGGAKKGAEEEAKAAAVSASACAGVDLSGAVRDPEQFAARLQPAVQFLCSGARAAALAAPDVVAGVAAALLGACRGDVDAYLVRDGNCEEQMEAVLEALDEAFSAVGHPDAILALGLAIKLGTSLDKGGKVGVAVCIVLCERAAMFC